MSVIFDISSNSAGINASPYRVTHTVGAGSNAVLFVRVGWKGGTGGPITGVTYNSVALTQVPGAAQTLTDTAVDVWYLVAPTQGSAQTVDVTFTGTPTEVVVSGLSAFGVDQINPVGHVTATTGTSTTPSATVASSANNLVFDILCNDTSGEVVTGGQTSDFRSASALTDTMGSHIAGAGSVTSSWSVGGSPHWALTVVDIAGVASVSYPFFTRLNVKRV